MAACPKLMILLFTCLLFCWGSETLPIDSSAQDAGSANQHTAPGILDMLNSLKGGNGLEELHTLFKEYSLVREFVKFAFTISPFYSQLFDEAAEHNPSLEVLLKAARGQVPDVQDMYHLVTNSRKKSMVADLLNVEERNRKYTSLMGMEINFRSTLRSASDLTHYVKIATGRDVTLSQKLVMDVDNGDVVITEDNRAQVNLLNVLHFYIENWKELNSSALMVFNGQQSDIFGGVLEIITKLDFSRLEDIKMDNSLLNNDKYSVKTGETLVTDPDAEGIQQDFEEAGKMLKARTLDHDKVLSLLSDLLTKSSSLFLRVLHEASQTTGSTSTQDQSVLG